MAIIVLFCLAQFLASTLPALQNLLQAVFRVRSSPSSLSFEIVTLVGCKGHECLVGHSSELPVKPIIVVAADVLLEVVAGDNYVEIKQD